MLPRLTDGAYDLVLVDADKSEYSLYFEQALRLLRPGGVIAFDNALWGDRVADPAQRDTATVALRDLVTMVRGHEGLTPVLVPSGDGLFGRRRLTTAGSLRSTSRIGNNGSPERQGRGCSGRHETQNR